MKRINVHKKEDRPIDIFHELEVYVNALIMLAIFLGVIFILLGRKDYNSIVWSWTVSLLAGFMTTAIIQSIIQKAARGKLDAYFLNIHIFGRDYSVSLLVIASVVFKFVIFRAG